MFATALHAGSHHRSQARWLLQAMLFAVAVVLAFGLMPVGTAGAAPVSIAQCNGISNVGGEGIDCSVTVVNTFDATTGLGSSTVTVQACTGAANAATTCIGPTTTSYPDVTTTVDQCNGSANGGGATATCTVTITNNITGGAALAAVTVRQCIGSGGAGTAVFCDPVQNTTGATVDQCNGSVAGGGALTCTVAAGSTQSASLPVTVTQCNGSALGGGAFLTCRTSIMTNLIAAAAPPPQQPAPPASASPSPAASPSTAPSAGPSAAPSIAPSASATPSVSIAPAPPATPAPDVPVAPDSGVLPDVLTPEVVTPVAAVPVEESGVISQGTSTALPTTGTDVDMLMLLGLLTTATGGVLLLGTHRPRGRHVLR